MLDRPVPRKVTASPLTTWSARSELVSRACSSPSSPPTSAPNRMVRVRDSRALGVMRSLRGQRQPLHLLQADAVMEQQLGADDDEQDDALEHGGNALRLDELGAHQQPTEQESHKDRRQRVEPCQPGDDDAGEAEPALEAPVQLAQRG